MWFVWSVNFSTSYLVAVHHGLFDGYGYCVKNSKIGRTSSLAPLTVYSASTCLGTAGGLVNIQSSIYVSWQRYQIHALFCGALQS